jgi:hypothetical protein
LTDHERHAALPADLSPPSRVRWTALLSVYDFTPAEQIALTEHLRAADRAEAFGRKGLHDLAVKERQASFRWWKSLRFVTTSAPKKIGRPSDLGWSAIRGSRAV